MTWRLALAPVMLAAMACSTEPVDTTGRVVLSPDPLEADMDADGLSDGNELYAYGTDPNNPDTDGDGLLDGEEPGLGIDPLFPDSDFDGYFDLDEINEGSDPADADSMIFAGGWPYYANKDEVNENSGRVATLGKRMKRFEWRDQHGDMFDLYNLYDAGKPIMIDLSGVWCGWCHVLADWLNYAPDSYEGYAPYNDLRDAVNNGEVIWVTVVSEGPRGGVPATRADAMGWEEEHGNPNIIVLTDRQSELPDFMQPNGWPNTLYLNPKMKIVATSNDNGGYTGVMGLMMQDLRDGRFNGVAD